MVVSNVAPTVSVAGPTTLAEGSGGTWTLTGSDAGPIDDGSLALSWTITDAAGAVVTNGSGAGVAWTPDDDGSYSVNATVADPRAPPGRQPGPSPWATSPPWPTRPARPLGARARP